MKLKEALELLDKSPCGDVPSKLNPCLTQKQAVDIVKKAVATLGRPKDAPCQLDEDVDTLMEKRVWQVYKNQKRPRYTK